MTERDPSPHGRSVLDWPATAGTTAEVLRELDTRRRRRHVRRAVLGAAVVVAVLAGVVLRRAPPPAPAARAPVAAVALPARQILSDGSIVELKEGADLAVAFAPAERRVVLRRGTAHFQVAKDAARPFIVEAGGLEVRAVGTAFSVQLGARQIEVLVTEGRVTVDHPADDAGPTGAAPAPVALVDAGDSVVLDLATPETSVPAVRPVPAGELDERLAWRAPRLEFAGTPLAEALPLFNRHSRRQLVLADPALGQLRLSGTVRADNTTALLHLLAADFGIRAESRGDNEIVLKAFVGQKPK